jgi:hypothetical protein
VTSDGGLVLARELDDHLGYGEPIERHLADRRGKNAQLPFTDLLGNRFLGAWQAWQATKISTT